MAVVGDGEQEDVADDGDVVGVSIFGGEGDGVFAAGVAVDDMDAADIGDIEVIAGNGHAFGSGQSAVGRIPKGEFVAHELHDVAREVGASKRVQGVRAEVGYQYGVANSTDGFAETEVAGQDFGSADAGCGKDDCEQQDEISGFEFHSVFNSRGMSMQS